MCPSSLLIPCRREKEAWFFLLIRNEINMMNREEKVDSHLSSRYMMTWHKCFCKSVSHHNCQHFLLDGFINRYILYKKEYLRPSDNDCTISNETFLRVPFSFLVKRYSARLISVLRIKRFCYIMNGFIHFIDWRIIAFNLGSVHATCRV